MAVNHSFTETNELNPKWELAKRVVESVQLKSSPKLCEFFLYVIDCCLRDVPEEATEQQIGVHVFRREPGYNSSDDSIVRSQARLLRLKLAAYFSEDGAGEEFTIEIPKGHYLPVFHSSKRIATLEMPPTDLRDAKNENQVEVLRPVTAKISTPSRFGTDWRYLAAVSIGIVLGLLLGYSWGTGPRVARGSSADLFWQPFLKGEPPLVIYSNPLFTGTPFTGMKLVEPGSSFTNIGDDTYTGTGEASAIRDLTQVFDAYHSDFILKRSRLVTWDEAKSRNLIFIGAPSQNSALQDLKASSDFAIALNDEHQGYIVNRNPRPGEPASFKPSSSSDEYAIIASLPGIGPGTRIAIFTGLTTNGTQAAVEFICNPNSAQQLAKAIGKTGGALVPFESVLHIKMSGGVPLQSDIAAIHAHV
jgi:hypothetical protein